MKSSMSNEQFQILLGAGVVVSALAVYSANKAGKKVVDYLLTDAINVTSQNNVVNTAVGAVVGQQNLQNVTGLAFARATLLNPLASEEKKTQARLYIEYWS